MRTLVLILVSTLAGLAFAAHVGLTAEDQQVRGTTVVIASVTAEVDGFVVVHATDADGGLILTPPLGLARVAAGEHADLPVTLDPDELAKYDYVTGAAIVPMLHVDADGDGMYTFPDGPDVPVMNAGEMVIATVWLQLLPSLATFDQTAANGALTIDTIVAASDGFLVVHAFDEAGDPVLTPPLGVAPVAAGVSRYVTVELDAEVLAMYGDAAATRTVLPMLHVDADGDGAYSFPDGPDVPVMADGGPLVATIELSLAGMGSTAVEVGEGRLDVGGDGLSVTFPMVTLSQPGFVALHAAETDGSLRVLPVLGVSAWLPAGTNQDVTVPIARDQVAAVGDAAFAMVHVDDGDGVYAFPRSDAPLMADGAMVLAPFTLR